MTIPGNDDSMLLMRMMGGVVTSEEVAIQLALVYFNARKFHKDPMKEIVAQQKDDLWIVDIPITPSENFSLSENSKYYFCVKMSKIDGKVVKLAIQAD